MTAAPWFRRLPWHRVALCALLLLAISLRSEGLFRPLTMHPDERVIIGFMKDTIDSGWLKGTTYPGGFFVMAEAARRIGEDVWFRPWQQLLFHLGVLERPERHLPLLEFGRVFNLFLSTLTVLLIYLLCRIVSGSRPAALFGAALFTFSPYPVEHSHYLESDIAMVMMLTLALLLWARHAEAPGWSRFAAAALATGYAVGTKYTMIVLLPPLLLFSYYRFAGGRKDRRGVHVLALAAAGLLLMAAGFVLATRGVLNFAYFSAEFRTLVATVHAETNGILGPAHAEPWVRQRYLLRMLWHFLGSVGAGWLLLAAAGAPLLLTGERRRFWPVTLIYPALYLSYFIFGLPWARSQEFMNFLPSLAVAAAVAAAWLIDRAGRFRWVAGGRTGVTIMLVALLVPTAQLGVAAASRCGWTDTRDLAHAWLLRHVPFETTISAEFYTSPSTYQVSRSEVDIMEKIETQGLPVLLEAGVGFFVRNASLTNRGQLDPRTGRNYPEGQAKLDAFLRGSELLRAWSPIDPERPALAFRSPAVELWRLKPAAAGPALDLSLPQPMYVDGKSRKTYFPIGRKLGTTEGMEIDRYERLFAVGGQEARHEPVFVILNTQGLPARANVKGFGRSHSVDLAPFDAAAIPLQRPRWLPRFGAYERIRAWTDPQEHVVRLPCWLRMAFDPTEAARLLAELGRPDRAWELLETNGFGDDPGLAFRLAVQTGHMAAASRLSAAATAQLETIETLVAGKTTSWRLNGLSAERYDEFSRLRSGVHGAIATLPLLERESSDAPPLPIEAYQTLPLRMAGPRTMRMEIRVREDDGSLGGEARRDDGPVELRDDSDRVLWAGAWSALAGVDFHPVGLSFAGTVRERSVNLRWTSPRVGFLEIRNLEVEWSLADALRTLARAQRIALARWNLRRGALADALAVRDAIREPGELDFDIDLRRLDLELALVLAAPEKIERSARRLLERAPSHHSALHALAGSDPQSARVAETLADQGQAVEFGRLAAIRRAEIANGRLRLVVEALSDETPALAVEVRERKFRRWARRDRVVFSSPRALHAGERVVVDLPIGRAKPANLGVSIISDNPFVQGELPVGDALTVRLDELLRATALK